MLHLIRRLRAHLTGFNRPAPTLASRAAYRLWAASYPPYPHNRLMETEQAAMLRLMPPLAGRDVLDLGCGTGRYGLIALEAGARRVVGVDDSAAMLRGAAQFGAQGGVRHEASMSALPFAEATFDVILCGLAIGHLAPERMRQAMMEIGRVLRPGGTALISDFHPYLALQGGQRTFQNGKTVYAVEHHIYFLSEYFAAIRDSLMILIDVAEPMAELNSRKFPAALIIKCNRV